METDCHEIDPRESSLIGPGSFTRNALGTDIETDNKSIDYD